MSVSRLLPILTAAALAGCTSIEWQELPQDVSPHWRHLELHRGDLAFIAARDSDAATDAYLQVEEVMRNLRDTGEIDPGRGLVLAVSYDDPLLAPAEQLAAILNEGHAAVTGNETPQATHDFAHPPHEGRAEFTEEDLEQLKRNGLRGISAGLPSDGTLAIPEDWAAAADWIFVMPTRACLEEMVAEMLDLALDKADLSFFEHAILLPFMPTARSQAVAEAQSVVAGRMYEATFAAADLDPVDDAAAMQACLERAGLISTDPFGQDHIGLDQVPPEMAAFFETPQLRFPAPGHNIGVSAIPTPAQLMGAAMLNWTLVVDLRSDAELAGEQPDWPIRRERLPVSGPEDLDEASATKLHALVENEVHMVLVCSPRPSEAAALVALANHYGNGTSAEETIAIGTRLGMNELSEHVSRALGR